ncbi:hypothetical protein TRFO_26035 [Tritrichomonas foetus]|uniref:Uncharacterized protein n=1 Tax=Tritrichomonas foetus TaxID=1144522 RepID=A0A1J4K461_9EUKA|nr:hypothetical protein TRFO_26035 [Tritrichomonas foetus]|eukprot:OHT05979.1 hypothetical protein TRFO_26035 [Tritrichomonas foetus]
MEKFDLFHHETCKLLNKYFIWHIFKNFNFMKSHVGIPKRFSIACVQRNEIQKLVLEIDNVNYQSSLQNLKKMFDHLDRSRNYVIVHIIILAVKYNAHKSELYAQFVNDFFQNNKAKIGKVILNEFFLPTIIDSWNLFFINQLLNLNFLSLEDLVYQIKEYFYSFGKVTTCQTIIIFLWFSSEIEKLNQELYKDMDRFIYYKRLKWKLTREYNLYVNDFKTRNSIHHNKMKNFGYFDDSFVPLIIDDNIDEFQHELVRRGLTDDTTILEFVFEKNYYLRSQILALYPVKLIDFSAYCGSVKIFKLLFLKENNENLEKCLEFAVLGGNAEIIHILEQQNLSNFVDIVCSCSILFYKNDIFYWANEMNNSLVNYYDDIFLSNNYEVLLFYLEMGILKLSDVSISDSFKLCVSENHFDFACQFLSLFPGTKKANQFLSSIHMPILWNIAEAGNPLLFKILFKYKIPIDKIDSKGANILSYSCSLNNIKMINFILNQKFAINLINTIDQDGQTPLSHVVRYNNVEIVKKIIGIKGYRPEPYVRQNSENISFRIAVENSHYEIVKHLYANNAVELKEIDDDSDLINIAAQSNDLEMVKILLDFPEINVNPKKDSPLRIAVKNRNMKLVKILVGNKRVDVNWKTYIIINFCI